MSDKPTETVDTYRRRNPPTWRDVFRRLPAPSPLQIATAALEQCECDRLEYEAAAESYRAHSDMLARRAERLRQDVERLTLRAKPAPVRAAA